MKTYQHQIKYDKQTKDLPVKITDECNYAPRQIQKIIKTVRDLEKQEHRWQDWN
jgi:hypothetical protein